MPDDCNLLIIAGPSTALSETELQKIDQYLAQGGRLFVLFNYFSIKHPTGLEPILAKLGRQCHSRCRAGSEQHNDSGQDVIVYDFNQHPAVNPLTQLRAATDFAAPRRQGGLEKSARRRAESG